MTKLLIRMLVWLRLNRASTSSFTRSGSQCATRVLQTGVVFKMTMISSWIRKITNSRTTQQTCKQTLTQSSISWRKNTADVMYSQLRLKTSSSSVIHLSPGARAFIRAVSLKNFQTSQTRKNSTSFWMTIRLALESSGVPRNEDLASTRKTQSMRRRQ